MPNQKKQKLGLETDATVIISNTQKFLHEKAGTSKETRHAGLYIESQGENSIKSKINRVMAVNDTVVLLKDFPNDFMYSGYLCVIIAVFSNGNLEEENDYEI